jgi:hypothetical protein
MPSREIALLARAQRALAQAQTIDEFRDVRDMCDAARRYARRKKNTRDVLRAACLAIQAEHGLGTVLSRMELAKGRSKRIREGAGSGDPRITDSGDPHTTGGSSRQFLRDLNLTKQESHRAQLLVTIPKGVLDRWLAEHSAEDEEPTLAAALQYAQELAEDE